MSDEPHFYLGKALPVWDGMTTLTYPVGTPVEIFSRAVHGRSCPGWQVEQAIAEVRKYPRVEGQRPAMVLIYLDGFCCLYRNADLWRTREPLERRKPEPAAAGPAMTQKGLFD